jgi:hypothetical protein
LRMSSDITDVRLNDPRGGGVFTDFMVCVSKTELRYRGKESGQ